MSRLPAHRARPKASRAHRLLAPLFSGAVLAALAAGGVQLQSASSTPSTDEPAAPAYGIWSDDTVPRTPADPETAKVTLGVKFTSASDGWVSAIQFYRSDQNVGPHTGQLWTARGKRLATVDFASSSSAGWHTAALSEPVRIREGAKYVASYTAPRGRYADDQYALSPTKPVVSGDLTALRGVYTYGSGVPSNVWRDSNYYVDVVFSESKDQAAQAADGAAEPAPTEPSTDSETGADTGTTDPAPSPTEPSTDTSEPAPSPTEPSTDSGTGTDTGTTDPAPSPTEPSTDTDTSEPAPSTPSSSGGFPNASNTGVPAGWTPTSTRTSNLVVSTAGSTVQDIRLVNANLVIDAPNVTVRRVEIQGGRIELRAKSGTILEEVSVVRAPGQVTGSSGTEAIGPGGYTARRVKIDGLPEGFRVGGKSLGYGPVTIVDSFVRVVAPDQCGDWHGDGLQGYDGPAVTVRNLTIDFKERSGCGGTAPFFYPHSQGNTSVDIDGLLVSGGGYSFRNGMPGTVRNLKIVNNAWGYGPINVRCSALTSWDAEIVTIDSAYQPTTVRSQACTTNDGS
jgi:hypothetical protein